nr:insulinase family protein [Vibrio sp. JPW-9-11-11]
MASRLLANDTTAGNQWQASTDASQTVFSLDLDHANLSQLEQHLTQIKTALTQTPDSTENAEQTEAAQESDPQLLEAITAFQQHYYQPSNTSVIVAGGVKSREIIRLVRQQFSDWPSNRQQPINLVSKTAAMVDANTLRSDNAFALIAFKPLASATDSKQQRKDMLTALLANKLIEQRIADALEKQQSLATVQVKNDRLFQQQLMSQIRVTGLPANDKDQAQQLVRKEIQRAAASGFTQAEYEMVVSQVRQELQRQTRLENQGYTRDQADRLVAALNQGIVYTDPSYDLDLLNFHVAHLTEFDISQAFERIWSPSNIREL